MAQRLGSEVSELREEAAPEEAGRLSTLLADERIATKAEQEVALHLLDNEQQLLAEVQAALRRLDEGTFGICTACQKHIGRDRLEALPYAANCVACAKVM